MTQGHDDYTQDSEDTLDPEPLFDWITRRTKSSLTGCLSAEDVLEKYIEETAGHADEYEVLRILGHLYIAITSLNGELAFRASLPQ